MIRPRPLPSGSPPRERRDRDAFRAGPVPALTSRATGWFATLFLFLAALVLARAAEPAPAPSPVVELPKFEVTDSRLLPPLEKWLYAEVPGFEILSNISERETKRFVRDFLLLQEVIREIMPGLMGGHVPVPTALLLCGRGKGFDEFLPADGSVERYGSNSLFFQSPERAAIVVDFAIAELQLEGDTRLESDPYRAFYAAYFRFLIRRQLTKAPPPWFEEGLVQLFAATEFDRKTIVFAQIGDGFGAEKIGDFNRMLHRRGLMPLREMLASEGPRAKSAFWAAQCYCFVHYCLYGLNKKNQQAFIRYVYRLNDEEPTEQLFKECFGKTYNQFAVELRGHIDFTASKKIEFRAKKGKELPEPPAVALAPGGDADVGRIKGEVLRLGGHSTAARNHLIAPYVRGERDPRLLAALGLDEKLAGQDTRARKFLEAAAAAKVQRARAYLELGRLRLDEARAGFKDGKGQLSVEQVGSILTPLFTAREQPPPLAEVYSLIAETWTLSALPPQEEHLAVVLEGVVRFPRDTALLLQATLLAAKRGFFDRARELAERGTKVAREPGDRDRFQSLAAAFANDALPAPSPPTVPDTPKTLDAYLVKPQP
ncbi:MAG: hypothetical protein JNK23_17680 [Opitutaceae bacterium]|nr:hypothetical protein [Opitutaceae bacterium]